MSIHSSTPGPNHVLMPRDQQLQPRTVPLSRRIDNERVDWDPVTPAAEDRNVVDFEAGARAGLIKKRFLDDTQAPDPDLLRLRIEDGSVLREEE